MEMVFQVQNVKCQGCASAIQDGLNRDPRISEVKVDVSQGLVTVEAAEDIPRQEVADSLGKLGYPVKAA